MDDFNIASQFPTVISPKSTLTYPETLEKIKYYKNQIEQLLLERGALIFRGFPAATASDFANFIETLNLGKFINYIGGDSPRDKVERAVYTSTEAPASFHIPLHQELSYIKNHPRHIYFFCEVEPKEGGATIIADARKVLKNIDPEVSAVFEKNDLTYISNYHYKSQILGLINKFQRAHKSWVEVFETESKDNVEKACVENEFLWQWGARDWLQIRQLRPAVLHHPLTQEKVWFNQAHLYDFNPKMLGWRNYLGLKLLYLPKSTILHEIRFADGRRIPRDYINHILDVLNNTTVNFPWKQGDVMVLDNILAMHGRAPFSGKRRILAAMTT